MIAAIDIGSSFIKGGLITASGELFLLQKIPTSFDTAHWLAGLKAVCAGFTGYKTRIRAIAVSGNGPTLVPLDKQGNPVCAPLSWLNQAGEKYSAEIALRIGNSIDPGYYLARVYAFCLENPGLYAKTACFLPCPEYVNFYLTGNAFAIRYCPEAEQYLWNEEALEKLGLDKTRFPPFIAPGAETGRVTAAAARELGIPENIPVVACGTDFLMSLLGTGTVLPGRICDRTGTSEGLNLCTTVRLAEPRLMVMPHIIPPYYNASGILAASGNAIAWIKANTPYKDMDYPEFFARAAAVKPAPDNPVFLPFLLKSRSRTWDQTLQGAFAGLKLEHGALHLIRAVIEATGFAMLDVLQIMEAHIPGIAAITVSGTIAGIPEWNQLRADILGRNILLPRITDTELTGAACLGFSALGEYAQPGEAAANLVKIKETFTPDREQVPIYIALYDVYRTACERLRALV